MRLRRFVAAATLALAACYSERIIGDRWNLTTVELTDAPFPYDSVSRVDIYIVSIAVRNEADTTNTGTGWLTVAQPHHRFDLIALSGGLTDTLGANVIPAGDYKAVRMVIDTDSSSVTSVTGQPMSVDWQSSAGRPALYALVENPITIPDSGTSVVLDFDVGRSFLLARDVAGCAGRCDGFIFSPVFRAVNRYVTGAVSGTVTGDPLASYAAPIDKVTITVYTGDTARALDEWWVRATGRTDAFGNFRIAYLLPGTYILRADAPRGSPYQAGVRANVVVTAGAEVVNQNITLPRSTSSNVVVTPLPAYAYVRDSVMLTAALVDSAGHQVPGATYAWSNLDTTVADLWTFPASPDRALFKAKAPGTARLFVSADGYGRTITIPVLVRPAVVDWVQVTPDSQVVAAGAAVWFTATGRDSAGNAIPNLTYTWTSSDTTVAIILPPVDSTAAMAGVKGLHAGSALIRATSGGRTGAATLRVQ